LPLLEEGFWRLKAVLGLIGQVRPGNRHLLEEGTRLRVGYGQRHFRALGAGTIGQTLRQTLLDPVDKPKRAAPKNVPMSGSTIFQTVGFGQGRFPTTKSRFALVSPTTKNWTV
jgi:hypothetical protein